MFTKDSRILNHRLTVPLTSVSKAVGAVGGVFTPTHSTVEPMLVTPSDYTISISSASDLEIDWGDGTVQSVKSGDDTTLESLGLISNKYTHTYTDSYTDKTISIKRIDGNSPIQFLSSDAIKTVKRWYSEGYQPFQLSNGSVLSLTFYGLGSLLETVPNVAPPNTTNLSCLFASTGLFNQDISGWDVSNVTTMSAMFVSAISFNQDLSSWCVTNITSLPEGFDEDATNWTLPRPVWGTCPVRQEDDEVSSNEIHFTTTEGTINYYGENGDQIVLNNGSTLAINEEQYLSDIAVPSGKHKIVLVETRSHSHVSLGGEALVELHNFPTLSSVSSFAMELSPNLVKVPTVLPSNLTSMGGMFYGATSFNQDISGWDVSNVTTMSAMFYEASAFNQPLDNWDVSKVTNMEEMFSNAIAFNQPLNNWDVSSVTDMSYMFYSAAAFNQDISQWCVPLIKSLPGAFATSSALIANNFPVWGKCPSEETASFEITDLFANNEQGFFYDPNDLSTMFQDSAGNVPVTGVGQPVGLMREKSGNNNLAFQLNSTSRPILRQNATTGAYYLEFDGVDDFFSTLNTDFSATDKVSIFVGLRNQQADSSTGMVLELSSSLNNTKGTFSLTAGKPYASSYYVSAFRGQATNQFNHNAIANTPAHPDDAVLSITNDIASSLATIRRNGVEGTQGTGHRGGGNFGNHTLFIGRRAGNMYPFKGHLYGLIGVGRLTTGDETATIERELANRMGVTLSV